MISLNTAANEFNKVWMSYVWYHINLCQKFIGSLFRLRRKTFDCNLSTIFENSLQFLMEKLCKNPLSP